MWRTRDELACAAGGIGSGLTVEKAKVEAMKARLFARLREHFQRRDRLRLVISYRRKYLEALVRQEQEYAETAAALAQPSQDHRAPIRGVRFIAERWPAGSRGFEAPDHPQTGTRRGATLATNPATGDRGQASLRDARCSRGQTGA